MSTTGKPRLLGQVREVLRLHHSEDPRTGLDRRHHVDASMVNKAIGIASTIGMTYVENPEPHGWDWFKGHTISQSLDPGRSSVHERQFPWFFTLVRQRAEPLGLHSKLVSHLDVRIAPVKCLAVVIKLGKEFFQTHRISQATFDVALAPFTPHGLVDLTTLPGWTQFYLYARGIVAAQTSREYDPNACIAFSFASTSGDAGGSGCRAKAVGGEATELPSPQLLQ